MKVPNGKELEYVLCSERPVGSRDEVLIVSEKERVKVAFVKSNSRKVTSSGGEVSAVKLVTFRALSSGMASFGLLNMSSAVWSVMAMKQLSGSVHKSSCW